MNENELMQVALGLLPPWAVDRCSFSVEAGRFDIYGRGCDEERAWLGLRFCRLNMGESGISKRAQASGIGCQAIALHAFNSWGVWRRGVREPAL